MHRYRWALAGLVVLVALSALIATRRNPAPAPNGPAGSAATAELLPAADRPPAPDFTGIGGWLNGPPLSLPRLRGRVVLVDFWTYSCVNCVRTIPHLQALYDQYRSRGLVVVGVHSPEFDFEKVPANVEGAVRRLKLGYPVALDPAMATWNAYNNDVWPAESWSTAPAGSPTATWARAITAPPRVRSRPCCQCPRQTSPSATTPPAAPRLPSSTPAAAVAAWPTVSAMAIPALPPPTPTAAPRTTATPSC